MCREGHKQIMKKEMDRTRAEGSLIQKKWKHKSTASRCSMQEQDEDKKELQAFGISSNPSVSYEY